MQTNEFQSEDLVASSRLFNWRGLDAEARDCHSSGEMATPIAFDTDVLILHHRLISMTQSLDKQERIVTWKPGNLIVIPQGHPVAWKWKPGARTTVVAVHPPSKKLHSSLRPCHLLRDELLAQILTWIDREVREGNPRGLLFIEALQSSLTDHLWPKKDRRSIKSPLDSRRFLRAVEYLHDNVDLHVSLEDLSVVTGLDRYQLQHGFKAKTGFAPYAYFLEVRARKAAALICTKRSITLAEIAAECGFSDQAHMTRIVKRITGLTPAKLRI